MRSDHLKGIAITVAIVILSLATTAVADPCLVVYPTGPCVYHYDPTEYYTVGPGHPLYDMEYDRGGLVLLEVGSDDIVRSIYQAPSLEGFEESVGGNDGYVFLGTDFELVVDGYWNEPRTFVNVIVVFDEPDPLECAPFITVGGQ
ncbi:MAG TPA: hypothetical protein VLA34_00595, partial [Candidatus Krumholzibacterium sp.]|nr:hypothetical protein [Candidatus Krumholzibacterium sp.]